MPAESSKLDSIHRITCTKRKGESDVPRGNKNASDLYTRERILERRQLLDFQRDLYGLVALISKRRLFISMNLALSSFGASPSARRGAQAHGLGTTSRFIPLILVFGFVCVSEHRPRHHSRQ
jgi:hypothetical protein